MEDGGGGQTEGGTKPVEGQVPTMSLSTGQIVLEISQRYGWFIILGVVLFYALWGKVLQKFRQFQENQEQKDLKKFDRNTAQKRMESMEMARRRLQEQYDHQAEIHAEHQRQKEEEKRKERIEDWDRHLQGKGYRNKFKPPAEGASASAPQPKKKSTLRSSDYNPLMGAGGGGGGFRPAPRSSGGG